MIHITIEQTAWVFIILGLALYFIAPNAKIQETGRILFFWGVGTLAWRGMR